MTAFGASVGPITNVRCAKIFAVTTAYARLGEDNPIRKFVLLMLQYRLSAALVVFVSNGHPVAELAVHLAHIVRLEDLGYFVDVKQ